MINQTDADVKRIAPINHLQQRPSLRARIEALPFMEVGEFLGIENIRATAPKYGVVSQ